MAEAKTNAYLWDVNNPRGYANAMGRYKTRKELAFLLEHIHGEKLRILDVGGGSGRFAAPLAERGHSVTVADISEAALNILRDRNLPGITTVCGDFLTQTFDELFDVVTGIESIQSFTSVRFEELFGKIHSHLKPGGWFVFTELNSRSWRYALRALRGSRNVEYNVGRPDDYVAALRASGFDTIRMEGFVWMPFNASSNSPLVPLFVLIESTLGLGRWIGQSPWLLIAARKPS